MPLGKTRGKVGDTRVEDPAIFVGVTMMNRIRNEYISETAQVTPFGDIVRETRLR